MRADGAAITIVGRAVGNPLVVNVNGHDRVTLRVVSTERRYDESSKTWVDGDEYGASVVCWRQVAANVLAMVRKGDPVVVVGRISTRKYEKDGKVEYYTDIKGDVVAFDLGRAKGRLKRADGDPAGALPGNGSAANGQPGNGAGLDPLMSAGSESAQPDELEADDLGEDESSPRLVDAMG